MRSIFVPLLGGALALATLVPAVAQQGDQFLPRGGQSGNGGSRFDPGAGPGFGGGVVGRGGGFQPGGGGPAVGQGAAVRPRLGGGEGFGDGGRRNGGFGGEGYRRHRGEYGVGAGLAGLAAGAVIGGAIASQNDGYYYGNPGYGYGYDAGPVYAPGPTVAEEDVGPVVVGGDEVAYCQRRYRSYDPASGTYLGYDGERHPCP